MTYRYLAMYISIKRIAEVKAPFDLCVENASDWTHFGHLHRKSHAKYQLLFKQGKREIFFYKARLLQRLPIFENFIVFREYAPEQIGYRHVYLNLRTGRINYLNASFVANGDHTQIIGDFQFWLSPFWRLFPRLFSWLFNRRMQVVMDEDSSLLRERIAIGAPSNAICALDVPEVFDFFDDVMKRGLPPAKRRFEKHVVDDLNGGEI